VSPLLGLLLQSMFSLKGVPRDDYLNIDGISTHLASLDLDWNLILKDLQRSGRF
jgi:hypothetical protein